VLLQDGETLPNGPVVISPDGLFPSLYREGLLTFSLNIFLQVCAISVPVSYCFLVTKNPMLIFSDCIFNGVSLDVVK
jgi:hypothetical protein